LDALIGQHGVTDVVCLLEASELVRYRVPDLPAELEARGVACHRFPAMDGCPPEIGQLEAMLRLIRRMLRQGRKVLVHCFGGLGRTGVVAACLLLSVDEEMSAAEAVDRARAARGRRAVASAKQFHFVLAYRRLAWRYRQMRMKDQREAVHQYEAHFSAREVD